MTYWIKFGSVSRKILGIGSCLENSQSFKGCRGSNPFTSATLVYGITVITLDFDSSNRGSIPRRPTKIKFLDIGEPGTPLALGARELVGSNPTI